MFLILFVHIVCSCADLLGDKTHYNFERLTALNQLKHYLKKIDTMTKIGVFYEYNLTSVTKL